MTLTRFIWIFERLLIRAKCYKCEFYSEGKCPLFNRVKRNNNCMYYKRKWFREFKEWYEEQKSTYLWFD